MPLVVIAAAAAVAASLPVLWWGLAGSRAAPNAAVARNLAGGRGTTDLRELAMSRSAGERAVRPVLLSLAGIGRRITPGGLAASLERRLTLAGRPAAWPIERVLAAKVLLAVAGLTCAFLYVSAGLSALRVVLGAATVALAYFTPDLLLYSRGAERQKQLRNELPDTLDQMSISVEAGLGFESAMARAGQNGRGPLAQELIRTLQEMQVGVPRTRAFRNLADRTTVADLRHFVVAIIQAESYGIPIATVLKTQAAEQRLKRRQRAEERAMKIPVKVIFPLVLCILPTLFIVLMGPAGIRMYQTLFGPGGAL